MRFFAGFLLGIIVSVGTMIWATGGAKIKQSPKPTDESFWGTQSKDSKEKEELKKQVNDLKKQFKDFVNSLTKATPAEREKLTWLEQNRINCFKQYKE